jgi:hypothetical protein
VRTVVGASDLAEVLSEALAEGPGDLGERGRELAARLDADNAAVAPRLLALIES